MNAAPEVDRRIVEALVGERVPDPKGRRLLLVYGRYTGTETTFPVSTRDTRCRVHVTDQHSVLGVVEAWQDHLQAHSGDEDVLVVTTTVEDGDLGWDVLAYAIGRSTRTVDRARIVAQRFGAVDIDPRIHTETWLVDALLDAEPPEGWPRNGSVLTRDTALRALIGVRLGRAALGDGALDTGTLLDWSRDPAGPARFAALPAAEREGLTEWLTATVGDAAVILLRLAAEGRAADAMPLGVVGTAVTAPGASPDAALAFGGLLGGARGEELRAFTDAVEGALERWVSEAESRHRGDAARRRVLDVLHRAEDLATQAGLTAHLADNRFLPATFTTRLHQLAESLAPQTSETRLTDTEHALDRVRGHHLARLHPDRVRTAEMAVRLARWLARPADEPASVAEAVAHHLADGAWADRALVALWHGDPAGDRVLGQAYRGLCDAARSRRDAQDRAFAALLASWTRHTSADDPGGCLLIERVLAEVAAPLAGARAPLVAVLDGMSGAVAADLAEQLADSWTEVSPWPRRAAAVSAIPSVTRASRTSLLTGRITAGEQVAEKDGFAAFWKRHRRPARLFHKSDIGGRAGHRLSDALLDALSTDDTVVGVVLNTIDAALEHGQEGDRTAWSLADVTYLPELLDAARNYGRPVVLVSDHGHVLDRADTTPVSAPGVESARWRLGQAGDGEVTLSGPRVVYGDGTVVVPWRENLRYTPRKAGYHGGASLAEMTVPVLGLLPSMDAVPSGWHVLTDPAPSWWEAHTHGVLPVPSPAAAKQAKARKPVEPDGAVPLFTVDEQPTAPATSLGRQVVATEVYAGQRRFVPRAPDAETVAAVIDALVTAGNRLPLNAVAQVAGRAARRPEFFAAVLERLLNVDGYQILSTVDGGRSVQLNVEMLRVQFGVGE